MFIYAYIGMLFFGNVKRQLYIDSHANFETFGGALVVLTRVLTLDSWPGLMYDCMVQPPNCSPELGDCGTQVAPLYFYTFVVLIAIVMLNLLTAVIIEVGVVHLNRSLTCPFANRVDIEAERLSSILHSPPFSPAEL